MILIDQAGTVTRGPAPAGANRRGVFLCEITATYRELAGILGDHGDVPGWDVAVTGHHHPDDARIGIVTIIHSQRGFDPMKGQDQIAAWAVHGPWDVLAPLILAVWPTVLYRTPLAGGETA